MADKPAPKNQLATAHSNLSLSKTGTRSPALFVTTAKEIPYDPDKEWQIQMIHLMYSRVDTGIENRVISTPAIKPGELPAPALSLKLSQKLT